MGTVNEEDDITDRVTRLVEIYRRVLVDFPGVRKQTLVMDNGVRVVVVRDRVQVGPKGQLVDVTDDLLHDNPIDETEVSDV